MFLLYSLLRNKTLLSLSLDTSNYPPDHPLYSTHNKNVVGKFKDEVKGKIIEGFVGLRSKMYTIKLKDSKTVMKVKGITKAALNENVTYDIYKECLTSGQITRTVNRTFRSHKHHVSTIETNKATLTNTDDKRHVCEDGIHTLAHGHYTLTPM